MFHSSAAARCRHLTAWFQRRNRRPVLGFFLGPQYPLHRFRGASGLPAGEIRPADIRVDAYLDDADRLFACHERAGGDLIWAASPFWGVPWLEAALGCRVIADHETGATRAEAPPGFAEKPLTPVFSEDNPWIVKMLEFIPALVARSGGRYPVGTTLMRGISDLLGALYGGEQFLFRMLEAPAEVERVATELATFWIECGRCMLSRLPRFHGGTGAFFYALWCPGRTIWLQEDAAALLSPPLYEQFIFPQVQRIAAAFEHTVIHLHPSQFIPMDYLMQTPVDVIELHVDRGGPSAAALRPIHEQVLAAKPLLIWGDMTMTDLDDVFRHLPYAGLAVNMAVSSVEEAASVWERAAALWAERGPAAAGPDTRTPPDSETA